MSERERLDWMRSLLEDGCLRGERCRSSTCRDEYPEEFAPRDAGGRLESRWCFVCRHREQLATLLRASSAEQREPEAVCQATLHQDGVTYTCEEKAGHPWNHVQRLGHSSHSWRCWPNVRADAPQADTAGEAELKAVREERDRLRKVLEPFAAMRFTGSVWENRPNADEVLLHHETGVAITLGHFRAARRALSESQPASPAGGET